MAHIKTVQEVRAEFDRRGMSITDWAKQHGFKTSTVMDILLGRSKARRGESHRAAVLLGLKDGIIDDAQDKAA